MLSRDGLTNCRHQIAIRIEQNNASDVGGSHHVFVEQIRSRCGVVAQWDQMAIVGVSPLASHGAEADVGSRISSPGQDLFDGNRLSLQIHQEIALLRLPQAQSHWQDRKSTRLNSSHSQISYAVFCLKKKKKQK